MGLMKKFLGKGASKAKEKERDDDEASGFQDSEGETSLDQTKSLNAPRRDLVQITLRETMRKHGIPSDWIECRTLSVLTKQHKQGMHVQFLVRKADYQILPWIHALQENFWEQVLRADPRAKDWLFSVGWEFYGKSQDGYTLPGAGGWKAEPDTQTMDSQAAPVTDSEFQKEAGDTLPPEEEDELAMDLQKLQAMMSGAAQDPAKPGKP